MNPNEKRIRVDERFLVLAEDIQRIEGRLIALMDGVHGSKLERYTLAGWHLGQAAEKILDGPTERSNLETALRLSIARENEKRALRSVDIQIQHVKPSPIAKFPEGA